MKTRHNRRALLVPLLICIFAGSSCSLQDAATENKADEPTVIKNEVDGLSAEEIFAQMRIVYETCKSYSDTGAVTTKFFTNDGEHESYRPFKTAFVRPKHFRFEFTERWSFFSNAGINRFIIWADNDDVQTYWNIDNPPIQPASSLDLAVAGATGISGSSAHTVPVLLLTEEISGWTVFDLLGPVRIPDSHLGQVACYRICGKRKESDSELVTLWISKETFLIRRIDDSNEFPDFQTETTTTYEPRVNIEIDESDLEFNHP